MKRRVCRSMLLIAKQSSQGQVTPDLELTIRQTLGYAHPYGFYKVRFMNRTGFPVSSWSLAKRPLDVNFFLPLISRMPSWDLDPGDVLNCP